MLLLALVLILPGAGGVAEEPVLVGASSVVTVPAAEACVVGLNDGRIVRIDLANGELQAQARIPELDGPANVERTAGDALLTWSGWHGGSVVLRGWEDLSAIGSYELGPDQRLEAWSPDGRRAVASTRYRAPWFLIGAGLEPVRLADDTCAVAFSPDGERLVTVGEERGELRGAAGGGLLASFALPTATHAGELGVEPSYVRVCRVGFHGADRVLVAWAYEDDDEDVCAGGFDLLALPGGEPVASVRTPWAFGEDIDRILGDAVLGRVAVSLGASGYAVVYRDDDWTPIWSVDHGGGNPNGMRLERGGHPRWLGVAGVSGCNVVDLETGEEVVPREVVAGLGGVVPSDSGRSLVGLRDVSLAVIDVEARALRFARVENAEGLDHLERGPALGR